jgi:hypothetical protein
MIQGMHTCNFCSRIVLLSSVLTLLVACSFNRGFIAPDQAISKDPGSGDIPLYMLGDNIDFPYTVSGHVFVDLAIGYADTPLNYTGKIPEEAKDKLKILARKIDADAVIGVVNNSFYGWAIATYFASGLAVNKNAQPGDRDDVITCLLPLADSHSNKDLIEYDSEIRIIARHVLTSKGYYVLTPTTETPFANSNIQTLLENNNAEDICGIRPDILVRIYTEKDSSGSGVFKAAAYSLNKSQYIMGESTQADPDLIRATVFGGLSGYIAAKVSASEVAISKLLSPIPKIAREVD